MLEVKTALYHGEIDWENLPPIYTTLKENLCTIISEFDSCLSSNLTKTMEDDLIKLNIQLKTLVSEMKNFGERNKDFIKDCSYPKSTSANLLQRDADYEHGSPSDCSDCYQDSDDDDPTNKYAMTKIGPCNWSYVKKKKIIKPSCLIEARWESENGPDARYIREGKGYFVHDDHGEKIYVEKGDRVYRRDTPRFVQNYVLDEEFVDYAADYPSSSINFGEQHEICLNQVIDTWGKCYKRYTITNFN